MVYFHQYFKQILALLEQLVKALSYLVTQLGFVPNNTCLSLTSQIGTPVYMAPELLSHGKYDELADVFRFRPRLLFILEVVVSPF